VCELQVPGPMLQLLYILALVKDTRHLINNLRILKGQVLRASPTISMNEPVTVMKGYQVSNKFQWSYSNGNLVKGLIKKFPHTQQICVRY
jgi:hypothetical protein